MTSYSPELAIPQVAQSQNNKYLTLNNAVSFQGAATNKALVSNTTGNLALTEAQFTRYMVFKALGRAGAFNITLPDAVNVTNAERFFVVWNADTTYTATVKAATTPGAQVVLLPGQLAVCYRNGVDTYALVLTDQSGRAYDLGFFVPGQPADGGYVMTWKATRAWKLLGNMAGSQCKVQTNPASTAVFDVQKNGSSVGSISINTSGVATFTTTAGAVESFAVGDVLAIVAPSPQDASLSDVGVALYGVRTA